MICSPVTKIRRRRKLILYLIIRIHGFDYAFPYPHFGRISRSLNRSGGNILLLRGKGTENIVSYPDTFRWMTNAHPQAVEFSGAQAFDNRIHAAMTTGSTPGPQTNTPGLQVHIIVDYQQFFTIDLEFVNQGTYRSAGKIHKG